MGARNAGAAGIETRSTVGRKPADKNFKKLFLFWLFCNWIHRVGGGGSGDYRRR